MINVSEFIKKNGGKYSNEVIEYCQKCVNMINKDILFKKTFKDNKISIHEFLNLLLEKSNEKLKKEKTEILSKNEFDKVFHNTIIYNEIFNFVIDDLEHIKLLSIDEVGKINYNFDDYAIKYFKDKYNLDFS